MRAQTARAQENGAETAQAKIIGPEVGFEDSKPVSGQCGFERKLATREELSTRMLSLTSLQPGQSTYERDY